MPNMSNISYGHKHIEESNITEALTSAWKSEEIPTKQRALVQKELENMYKGNPPIVYQVLARSLQPYVFPHCTILEIGCASGYYYEILEYLLNIKISYTGVDYSEPLISMAKDYYPKANFYVADGSNLPFKNDQFYIVISSCVLLHTPNYEEQIKETARVAERYVIAHRTPISRHRETQYFKKYAYGVETVEIRYNEKEIVSEFEKNGLKLITYYEYLSNPQEDIYEVNYVFKKINDLNKRKYIDKLEQERFGITCLTCGWNAKIVDK
jgi:ubiquinone/menaquinone biosynthesis C-methylase UbiE